jgi:spore coat protein A
MGVRNASRLFAAALFLACVLAGTAFAAPLPGGTLDPLTIPKFVTPLVIPPVMNDNGTVNKYGIAVRQFKQQILPGGIWNTLNGRTDNLAATTIWSYGPSTDSAPDSSGLGGGVGIAPAPNSQFNYPAYTIETTSGTPVNVRWINGLVDNTGNFLPHLLPIDQTLHWANPPSTGCMMGTPNRTDCATDNAALYTGPVPIITHVHGAHVDPHSDGYPEAWFLPAANNIPSTYARKGSFFDDATGTNPGNLGYADFRYRNDNPATTLWYHDHALGMTRSNVYAGPAGFWLVRGGAYDGATVGGQPAILPGPAPVAGQTVLQLNIPTDNVRRSIREIPIAIQDRSFNADGSLFYPDNRAFFEGLNFPGHPEQFSGAASLLIPFAPTSDIAPIWNPEAFFNTMVVNGSTWPMLEVAPAFYRFRLLNGCNSRFLNLSLCVVDPATDNCFVPRIELPFYQIGAEQGFLSQVVQIQTGYATPLPGNGFIPLPVPAIGGAEQALLMGLAERADVIVDFTGLDNGTKIRMINAGPDSPFGGFPIGPAAADITTTGQVMQFVVNHALLLPSDGNTTPPEALVLNKEPALGAAIRTRQVSLNEAESEVICAAFDNNANVVQVPNSTPPLCAGGGAPFAPKEALLGVVNLADPAAPLGTMLKWEDTTGTSNSVLVTMADNTTKKSVNVTENPRILGGVAPIEDWEIYNFTVDAHPIHLHLVEFQVVNRTPIPPSITLASGGVQPWESGFKDTVIAYPGEITTVRAKFDIPGLYVWHCHIVEHEDNEMMRPYVVSIGPKRGQPDFDGDSKTDTAIWRPTTGQWWIQRSSDNAVVSIPWGSPTDRIVPGDYDGDGKTDAAIWRPATGQWWIQSSLDNAVISIAWGSPTDNTVPGDYDGDGMTDVAVWRPSSGAWLIQRSSDNVVVTIYWGSPTDKPVPGDYDGDGKTDVAIWRPSTGAWWIQRSSDSSVVSIPWGSPNDIPVPGDYDGDGRTDAAVWRPSTGVWWIQRSSDSVVVSIPWGSTADIPVPGDYDGDGKTDAAIWRPSSGQWWIQRSSDSAVVSIGWGSSSDQPVKSLQ